PRLARCHGARRRPVAARVLARTGCRGARGGRRHRAAAALGPRGHRLRGVLPRRLAVGDRCGHRTRPAHRGTGLPRVPLLPRVGGRTRRGAHPAGEGARMTYALISLPFLVLGVIAALVATRSLPHAARRRRWWA